MTFGDYNYGPDDSDDVEADEDEIELLPPDHPASTQQCDHPNCSKETPGARERICDGCTEIMRPETPNECELCGASIDGRKV